MDREETLKIMSVLKAAYPAYYSNMPKRDAENAVSLWNEMFAEDDYAVVGAAVKALLAADEKGYPPTIGAVKSKIHKITQPQDMTELEAWALVRRAITGASMDASSRRIRDGELEQRTSAERKYDELPQMIQRLIGSPSQLAMWASLSTESIETVVQSNFMRSYKARCAADREYNALPADIKKLMETVSSRLSLPQEGIE